MATSNRIEEVAAHLRSSGMQVDQVLNEIKGVISGSVPDDRRQLLKTVTGVQSVEDAATVQLPRRNPRSSSSTTR